MLCQMAVLSNGSLSFRGMLVVGGGASFMTPWQPVDLRTGVMNDAPPPISPARIESLSNSPFDILHRIR
jgi:hypothetical protein